MNNVFENIDVTATLNDQFKQLTDLQTSALEPVRVFAAVAADAVEQIARKNYAVVGDVLEYSVKQVNLPLSSDNLSDVTSAQVAEANALAEVLKSRATEYSDLAQQFQAKAKAKETNESISASFK